MRRGCRNLAALALAFCAAPVFAQQHAARPAPKKSAVQPSTEAMSLTAKSEHARQLFGEAFILSGNYRLDECLKNLRTATAEDADFAAGWSLLAYFATDAHEAADALTHARSLAGKSSPSEMLMVRWVAAIKQNDQIAAISNLNDLVHRESSDKFVLYLAGRWFVDQRDQQKKRAMVLTRGDPDQALVAIVRFGCAACHSIPGARAPGGLAVPK